MYLSLFSNTQPVAGRASNVLQEARGHALSCLFKRNLSTVNLGKIHALWPIDTQMFAKAILRTATDRRTVADLQKAYQFARFKVEGSLHLNVESWRLKRHMYHVLLELAKQWSWYSKWAAICRISCLIPCNDVAVLLRMYVDCILVWISMPCFKVLFNYSDS